MAESIKYGVELNTGKLVSSAEAAASALDSLNDSIKADQQDLGAMQKSLKLLGGETDANRETIKKLKDAIDIKRKSVSAAALDVQKLGGAYGFAKKPANDFRHGLQELGKEAKDLGGPVGQLFGRMEQLSKFAGSSKAKFVLGAVGIAAIGAAAAAASLKMFGFAQEISEARDKEQRELGGFLSLQKGVKDFQADSEALQGIIGRISHNSSASREEVSSVAKELINAGISGKKLENALEAANMASVVAGSEGVKAFVEQAKAAKAHGQSVESVATTFRTKYGPSAKAALLSNDALAKRFKDNIGSMFEGVNFGPLQEAKQRFVNLFDQTTPLGKALHDSIKGWLQGMADFFTGVVRFAKDFIINFVIGAKTIYGAWLDLQIAFYDTRNALFDFGVAVADWVERSGKKLTSWIEDVKLAWQQFDAVQLGKDIIAGLLRGLMAGWEALKKGVTAIADTVKDTFKSALGIASPSKVFTELGKQIPRGLEVGINAEKPAAERAVANLVPVSMSSVPRAQSTGAAITINAPITIESRGDILQDVASLEAQLTAALSRCAQQMGAALA